MHLLAWEEREGEMRRYFGMKGYQGERCGRIRYGERADGRLVMLSGDVAHKELERGIALADNCSRIDLAVTVRQEPFDPDLERNTYTAYVLSPMREGKRARATLIQSDDSGSTFYLGSRDSELFCRLYNKQQESKDAHYTNCHRYELELKGDRAGETATRYANTVSQPDFTWCLVYDYLYQRGITPIFGTQTDLHLTPGFRRRSDTDKQLEWLAHQVRPTVDRLREFGKAREAHSALWPDDAYTFTGPDGISDPLQDSETATGDGS
jgi:hypothetical protein